MESDNLSDLRRKIGLHEQTLTLWYSSLMYGSLRRLETGQEGIYAKLNELTKKLVEWTNKRNELYAQKEKLAARKGIITALKNLQGSDPSSHHRRQEGFASLDDDSLRAVLRKAGIPEKQIKANLKFAKDYIRAPKEERREAAYMLEQKTSRRCSRKLMETEIKQKEAKVEQKETEVSTQIHETMAAINKLESSSEDRGRPLRRETASSPSIPVNLVNVDDEKAKSSRPTSNARTIQRVQLDQFDPEVLTEHDIPWEPDPTDERYIILKQEPSEEMIKILYQETKIRRAANAEKHAQKEAEERRNRPSRASSASVYIDRENSYLKPGYKVLQRRASDTRARSRPRPLDDGVSLLSGGDSRSSMSSYEEDHDLFIRRDSLRPGDRRSRPASYGGRSTDLFGEMKLEKVAPPPPIPLREGFFDERYPEIFITPSSRNESTSRTRPDPPYSAPRRYLDESGPENIKRSKSSQRSSDTPGRFATNTDLKRSSSARRYGDSTIRLDNEIR